MTAHCSHLLSQARIPELCSEEEFFHGEESVFSLSFDLLQANGHGCFELSGAKRTACLHPFKFISPARSSISMRKALSSASSSSVELARFPGGSEAFEMAVLFIYDSPLPLDPFNVAALSSAAFFLEMTNLGEQSDLYLNQVVLQNWDDALIVLQRCQTLLPWAEELLLVSRCVEALAFMACMEMLDPEQQREGPVWVKDLIALPFDFFKRIIASMRRQGMEEKYVSPLIVFYGNKWVLSKKTYRYWESREENYGADEVNKKITAVLEGLIDLLPSEKKAAGVIPVGFYFAILSKSLKLGLNEESRARLEDRVASVLQFAQVENFLLPESGAEFTASSPELEAMKRIVSIHLSCNKNEADYYGGSSPVNCRGTVAELWDRYLSSIAVDPKLDTCRFMELIEVTPMEDRETHDHLYKALSSFLQEHPHVSSEEKAAICKQLKCQKLSQPICIQAVQNEQMPLRLIVQALSVQQLHTHQAFKDFSESFRYMQSGEFSGSLPSLKSQLTISQYQVESPYEQVNEKKESESGPQGDYECTSFRIQVLEEELMYLKKSLEQQNALKGSHGVAPRRMTSFRPYGSEKKFALKMRSPPGRAGSCIGSISWDSQRKHVSRLLKAFGRIKMFGKGQKTKKTASSGHKNSAGACKSQALNALYGC
ncbi:BTB/POZ domain-containing protein [Apostasia shenzhenica]|uniref:BTB/POZ domain-containing protein n=1 Tax=Apostasia shenzhenica TaxID=1088818 RepID=A0A2I0ARP0_9ASPA|nr:BTB/POZ domain-containing protein [Apostasia shenzhenica]